MSRKSTAVPTRPCAALLLVAAAAVAGCNRPADEVEPTPPPLQMQVPEALGPPLIEPAPLPPIDPSVDPPPDPSDPASPPAVDPAELPTADPTRSKAGDSIG